MGWWRRQQEEDLESVSDWQSERDVVGGFVWPEGDRPSDAGRPMVFFDRVGPEYFATMGATLSAAESSLLLSSRSC
jgi:hypothetical protein